jgi:hypothetical protein
MIKSNLFRGLFVLVVKVIALIIILSSVKIIPTTINSMQKTNLEIIEFQQLDIAPKIHGSVFTVDNCTSCHTQPITGYGCIVSGCHESPPTIIDEDINFPHHDPAPGGPLDNCSSIYCHDAGDDIRYVTVLDGNHTYCMQCHTENRCHICHRPPGPPDQ